MGKSGEKKIVITQSNYIPWRGYFDLIRYADIFVLYDSVQYTRRDWRNRNQIKTAKGPAWLTIPTLQKGLYEQTVAETEISDADWSKRHWRTLCHNYSKAPAFSQVAGRLERIYEKAAGLRFLSDINALFLRELCASLEISTPLLSSAEFPVSGDKTERLVSICQAACSTVYVSGPGAKVYLDESFFEKAGIKVQWANYNALPVYPQMHGAFNPRLSILDLLFNTGTEAMGYLSSRDPVEQQIG